MGEKICVKTLKEVVIEYIYKVLEENDFVRNKTARQLDISTRTITNYIYDMRKMGLYIPKYNQDNKYIAECRMYSIFPSNEYRLKYRNEMLNRDSL